MKIALISNYLYYFTKKNSLQAPSFKSAKAPRVAFCLSGLVGGVKGKSGENIAGSEEVLRIAYKYYKKRIFDINENVDIFIHTWNVDLKKEILELYNPKKSEFQKQVTFYVPEHVRGEQKRKRNHYSRWYSTKKVVKLKEAYEKEHGFKYDTVFVTRFDLAFQKDLDFSKFDNTYFYTANWVDRWNLFGFIPLFLPGGYPFIKSCGLADLWFFSNSENVDKFAELYDHLDDYTLPGKAINTRLGISNHTLMSHHIEQIGLAKKLRFVFNRMGFWKESKLYGPKETTPLIRRKFFASKR